MQLLPIDEVGRVSDFDGHLSEAALMALDMTKSFYRSIGYLKPWISYLAVTERACVGCCSFKSAPKNGQVEIAYFTFPGHEGRGVATSMARELIDLARAHCDSLLITAATLPGRNASHRVLEKLGFSPVAEVDHPDDGVVLEWHLLSE